MTTCPIRVAMVVATVMSVCALRGLAAQSQRPTSNVRSAAVSGVVTEQPSGKPLRGVVVSLSCSGPSLRSGISLRTQTDSKGRFVFLYLPASDHCGVSAAKSGYVSAGLARQDAYFSTAAFAVADDEWIRDANIVMLVAGSISGTVLDERGEPLVNAPIRLLRRVPIAGISRWASGPLALTDDRGVYRLPGLTPGTYIASVPSVQSAVPADTPKIAIAGGALPSVVPIALPTIPTLDREGSWQILGPFITPPSGSANQAYPIAFYPNARVLTDATPIDLAIGEDRRGIDFLLAPVTTTTIRGRVSGPADILPRIVVRLMQEGAESLGMGSEQATALVAADGSFRLINVPVGRYVLDARTSYSELNFGGSGSSLQLKTPGLQSDATFTSFAIGEPYSWLLGPAIITRQTTSDVQYYARLPLTVSANPVTDVRLSLERGMTISGRVVNEDGSPVSVVVAASVEPANGDPMLGGQTWQTPLSRNVAPGTFAVHGLLPGDYFLRVGFARSIVASGVDYTTRPFTATAGQDITDVVVTRASKPATVSGLVRNQDGSSARAGAVVVFPVDSQQWSNVGVQPQRIKSTGFFGREYQTPFLPAGEYYIIAVEEAQRDGWLDPRFFKAAAPVATRITLEWGKTSVQDLTLQRVVLK